jgi:uncharacterized protein YndB with AHSA1/START domain
VSAEGRADRQVKIDRLLDAPRELVFAAFTDPAQVAIWWAPEGLEVPTDSVDVDARVGGRINFSMVDPNSGEDFPVRFEIVEMTAPELLVLESPPVPELGMPERIVTRLTFEEDGDRTKLTVTQGPHTDEMVPQATAGWTSILEKLAAATAS